MNKIFWHVAPKNMNSRKISEPSEGIWKIVNFVELVICINHISNYSEHLKVCTAVRWTTTISNMVKTEGCTPSPSWCDFGGLYFAKRRSIRRTPPQIKWTTHPRKTQKWAKIWRSYLENDIVIALRTNNIHEPSILCLNIHVPNNLAKGD